MKIKKKQTGYSKGLAAEFYAVFLLTLKGYRFLKWRYRCPSGEIDLVMRRGSILAFIEVKRRRSREEAFSAILPQSRRRIERAAERFLKNHPRYAHLQARFDVIAVYPGVLRFGPSLRAEHLDNAWSAGA